MSVENSKFLHWFVEFPHFSWTSKLGHLELGVELATPLVVHLYSGVAWVNAATSACMAAGIEPYPKQTKRIFCHRPNSPTLCL